MDNLDENKAKLFRDATQGYNKAENCLVKSQIDPLEA